MIFLFSYIGTVTSISVCENFFFRIKMSISAEAQQEKRGQKGGKDLGEANFFGAMVSTIGKT